MAFELLGSAIRQLKTLETDVQQFSTDRYTQVHPEGTDRSQAERHLEIRKFIARTDPA
jgi:hypothetical protein